MRYNGLVCFVKSTIVYTNTNKSGEPAKIGILD